MYDKEKEKLKNQKEFTMDDFLLIVKILRCKDGGCPWDIEQTHKSIVSGFVEETYEVVEAIEDESPDMLCEELGDVLLQIVFHAGLSEDEGDFNFGDVINGICNKMIIRHPHVFGDVVASTSGEVLNNWDKIKAKTKNQQNLGERLDSVAKPLPALIRMQKLIHKSAKSGVTPSMGLIKGDEGKAADILLSAVTECENMGVDAETALRHLCDAFIDEVKSKNI